MPSFHDVRFPSDISFGSAGGPEFSTSVVVLQSGDEQRNVNWSQARARYNVAYGVRTESQLASLIAFFRARMGRAYGFRFKDWADYQSAATVTPTDQVLGTGDNTATTFQLVKTYPSGAYSHTRTITKPVAGTVRVALLGTEVLTGWSVDPLTGILTFASPPASGVSVTAGFQFDVPVRFDTDRLATSLDAYGLGSALDVTVVEVRG